MSDSAAPRARGVQRLRVLLISDVYFPRVNGVSTSIRTFRQDLAACGVDSVLIAPSYGPDAQGRSGASGEADLPVIRVAAAHIPGDPEDRRMRLGSLRGALAALNTEHFDLVHVQTPFVAHYAGVRFARRRGLPVVATYHTLFEEYLHHYVPVLPRGVGRALARAFTRSQCAQLTALVAPSEPMQALLREYGVQTRIEVIPTGLPADRYLPGDGRRFREAFHIPQDAPLLLYVGRVAHEKNIEFLLQMFVAVRQRRPEARLAIAGEGPAREHLQALAQRLGIAANVHFIGYLDRRHGLSDCYAAGDVFVFASRTETQGLVLLEALAQGRPVVSTAHLGTAAVLRADSGASIAPDDVAVFAQQVTRVLEQPVLAERMSAQALSYSQTWASAHMAARLAELYRELAEQALATGGAAAPDLPGRA